MGRHGQMVSPQTLKPKGEIVILLENVKRNIKKSLDEQAIDLLERIELLLVHRVIAM
jgi:hypothetical protein